MGFAGKKQKAVLIIVQNLPVPFDRRVWLEATTLKEHGYKVSVICPKKYSHRKKYEKLEGIHIFRYPLFLEANSNPLAFLFEFLSCYLFTFYLSLKVLLNVGFKVIHICNPPETYFSLAFFYKLLGKKIIFDHHDLSPEMFLAKKESGNTDSFFYKLLVLFEKLTFKSADIVITTNESHKKVANERGGVKNEDVYIVRSGPDIARFKGFKFDQSLKNNKEILICYLGEMCVQDGVGTFLKELAAFNSPLFKEKLQFAFIGKGPEQPNLVRLSKKLELDSYVTFTGRISDRDLANYLITADICIDTSSYNLWTDRSTMNKIIEYMAFNNPIVSFTLTETRFSAGEAALYAQNGNYADFFDKIVMLIQDGNLKKKMGAIGKERFETSLSWSHSVPNLLKAYDRVLN